ncbi:MAG: VWA domain-containing protein [Bacteroidetes bacterium]|nr:VWA domain-containing protein [Bacteroidota bacterium]
MLSFEHTDYLLGLLVVIPLALLFLYVLYWKRKTTKILGDEKLVEQLTGDFSKKKFQLKFLMVMVGIVLLIVAAANLRKPESGSKEKKAGIDVMIALDVSKSMWAEDIKPSRLDVAKQFINNMIDQMGDNRVGLVLFAGRAFLQMPLTSDFAEAKLYVSNASPDAVPVQGTVIGDALQLCSNSLDIKEKKFKSVVLISDGEDHDPHSKEILQELSDNGVVVNTVGVGTVQGSPILVPGTNSFKVDANGQTVVSKLNEGELMQIAIQTGGIYQHLDNAETTAGKIADHLNGMEKKAIEGNGDTKQYASFYYLFVILALFILLTEIFIPETKSNSN